MTEDIGSGFTQEDREELIAEMVTFDSLPEQVRRLLRDAPLHVPPEVVATCLRVGMEPAKAVARSIKIVEHYGTEGALQLARETA